MTLPSNITRTEVASLIAEEYSGTMFDAAVAGSAVLSAFPRVNMGTKTNNIPVLATLPTAGWVTDTDNTAVKPTSDVTWANKTLVAEELAVIVPVHENTLDDATENILDDIAQLGGQAIGKALDQAVIFGTNKPASWTSAALLPAATSASQTYTVGSGEDDLYGSFLTAAAALADAGFDPMSAIAKRSLAFQLQNLRGSDGHLVLDADGLRGFDTTWSRNGAWDPASAIGLVVDPNRVRIGVRQDITVKFLDQATISGSTAADNINLAERDMVALRLKARFAYVLGVGVTSQGTNKTPVAAVLPAGSSSSSSSSSS